MEIKNLHTTNALKYWVYILTIASTIGLVWFNSEQPKTNVLSSTDSGYLNSYQLALDPFHNTDISTFYQKIVVTKSAGSTLDLSKYTLMLSPSLPGWSTTIDRKLEFSPWSVYQPDTTYTVRLIEKNNTNNIIARWQIRSPKWEETDITLLNSIQSYKMQNYPLSDYLPKDSPYYSITYTDKKTIRVNSTSLPTYVLERKRPEVNNWIKSKGINPTSHVINFTSTAVQVPSFKPWALVTAEYAPAGSTGTITSIHAGYDRQGNYFESLAKGGRIWIRYAKSGAWTDVTSNFSSVGDNTKPLTAYQTFAHPISTIFKQRVVRGGLVYEREYFNNNWSSWKNVTVYFDMLGGAIRPIDDFGSFVTPYNFIAQRVTKNGVLYERDNAMGWSDWTNVTSLLGLPSLCTGTKITGMSTFRENLTVNLTQFAVVDGKLCRRQNY